MRQCLARAIPLACRALQPFECFHVFPKPQIARVINLGKANAHQGLFDNLLAGAIGTGGWYDAIPSMVGAVGNAMARNGNRLDVNVAKGIGIDNGDATSYFQSTRDKVVRVGVNDLVLFAQSMDDALDTLVKDGQISGMDAYMKAYEKHRFAAYV